MGTYYQLIFLGDTSCSACRSIRTRFFELLEERGLDSSIVAVLDLAGVSRYSSIWPAFVFFFGGANRADDCLTELEYLKGNADAIYPVYFTEGKFLEEVPEVLHTINGVLYSEEKLDSIVNVALEELRLLRKTRRVFISYRRSESSAVANQLYDVLSRHQFDVFMDTYSIRGSAGFQAELHHRLTDSDVLIQLNSPHFKDSDWCKEEISDANARKVGVLQINWPGVHSGASDQLSIVRQLADTDFRRKRWKRNTSVLKSKMLSSIALQVESVRARNLAARQDGLTAEFVKEANRQGRTIIKEPTFLVEEWPSGKFWYYIPAIGVPQSINFHDSLKMLGKWGIKNPEKVFLIYDELSILEDLIRHLYWMSNYFEVKTIKKSEFEKWLITTKGL